MVNIPIFRQTFQLKVGIGLTDMPDYYSMKEKTNTNIPETGSGNLGFSINEMADHYSMKQKEKTNETIPLEMENGLTNIPDSNGMKEKNNGSKLTQTSRVKTETGLTSITHEEGMKQTKITMNCINSQCDHVDGSVVSKLSTPELITLYERLNWFNPNHQVRMMQLLSIMKNVWIRHNSFINEQVNGDNPQNYFVNKMTGGLRCQCELCEYVNGDSIFTELEVNYQ